LTEGEITVFATTPIPSAGIKYLRAVASYLSGNLDTPMHYLSWQEDQHITFRKGKDAGLPRRDTCTLTRGKERNTGCYRFSHVEAELKYSDSANYNLRCLMLTLIRTDPFY